MSYVGSEPMVKEMVYAYMHIHVSTHICVGGSTVSEDSPSKMSIIYKTS